MFSRTKPPKAEKLKSSGAESFFSKNLYVILAFCLPFLLMAIGFAAYNVAPFGILKTMVDSIAYHLGNLFPSWGIEAVPNLANPWGDRQMHVVDLWHQYYPFLVDLQDKLQSGGSLLWTWSVGMGSNFIAMMSYYLLSPLNFLSIFIPEDLLSGYLAVITVVKIACAGMFTAISLRIIFKRDGLSLVFFSLMFALCSYNMGYYWCVIWLDSVAMLPLAVAGTVSLLRDGKYKLFILSLALAVIFNYYIGLFICIAVFLTAIGYTAGCWHSMRKSLKDLLRTLVCSATALLMTASITVPAYLALQNCYKSTSTMPTRFDINIGEDTADGVFDALHQIISNLISFIAPTYKEGLPNVSTGILVLVLLGVFFCSKKIKLGEKLFSLITFLFLIASFIFRHLDYMWHGFHYPNMLPYRFSFLVSFLLIYMAYRAYTVLEHSSYLDIIIAALVFALIVLGYFLREEEDFSQGAIIASISIGAVMLIALLLFTFRVLPRRAMALLLCLLVTGEMCATAIIGVNTVGTTTTTSYPKEETNVDRLLSHIEQWDQEETPDIYRTEVDSTQTLNDGALNGYPGVSVFNSMANVSITKFVESIGLSGWKAGNRYSYYESSPVTNTLINMRYLITRTNDVRNTKYMEMVDYSGSVELYENTEYISMGFMTNSALSEYVVPDSTTNPFENQIEFWRLATGIEEPLYNQLTVVDVGHSSDNLTYTKHSEGYYTFSPGDTTSDKHLKFNFYLEEDALVFAYYYVSGANDKGNIYINDKSDYTMNVKQPFISVAGDLKAGDKVSLYCKLNPSKTSTVRAYCYTLNEEVFEAGIEKLKDESLTATKVTDTCLEGTINVKEAGLLYTSIPYEKGWKVYVDGEEAEMSPVGNAMCAVNLSEGEHTVKFTYIPDGFLIGIAACTVAIIIFAMFCLCTSKKFKDKKACRCVVWLFDPTVKERVKADPISEENTDEDIISPEDE